MKFTDTLDKEATQIEKPPTMPVGTYVWVVTKHPTYEAERSDEWEFVEYAVRCVRPTEEVDPDILAEFTAKAGKLTDQFNRVSFLFSKTDEGGFKKTEFNHKQFLTETLKCWEDGASLKQAMAASVNKQFLGWIKWQPDKQNPELMHANIGRTAPLP